MSRVVTHKCSAAAWCGLCDHNELAGGTRNHPTAPRRPAAPAVRTPTPARGRCLHLGERTEERAGCNGRLCRHTCEAGEPVAIPGTVCQACPKWEAEYDPAAKVEARPDLPRWRPVPPPAITPTRPRAVITVVIGGDAEQLHAVTGPSQRRYAETIGAEYVVIRGATQDERMKCAEKWRLKDYVPLFPEGTVYFDADVWVGADAPDVLAATPPDAVGLVDVSPATPGLLDWFPGQIRRLCETQGITPPTLERKYWNSGVWAGRPEQARYWEPPPLPYPPQWCTEEMWCRLNAQLTGLRIHDLDPRFNWTWIEDRDLSHVRERRPWVWHFAGMGNAEAEKLPQFQQSNRVWRLALLRLLAATAGGGAT